MEVNGECPVTPAHSAGEHVVYRNGTVCRIGDIRTEDLWGDGARLYYVLQPVFDPRSVTYVPADLADSRGLLRCVLTREEIDAAIDEAETGEPEWPGDAKQRAILYDELIARGNAGATLMIWKRLSGHRDLLESKRKRLYASDARILERAERSVTEEFAFALGIERAGVLPYIKNRLKAYASSSSNTK